MDFYPTEKCPICEGNMSKADNTTFFCPNRCYVHTADYEIKKDQMGRSYVTSNIITTFVVFGYEFSLSPKDTEKQANTTKKLIKAEVEYWREDDRYLVEILAGGV